MGEQLKAAVAEAGKERELVEKFLTLNEPWTPETTLPTNSELLSLIAQSFDFELTTEEWGQLQEWFKKIWNAEYRLDTIGELRINNTIGANAPRRAALKAFIQNIILPYINERNPLV